MLRFFNLFDILANLVLWVLLLLFVIPVLIILLIWKLIVILIAKLFKKTLHPTDPNDTYFAIDDTKNIPIVNAAQIWRIKDEDSRRRYRNFYCYLVKFGGFVFKKSVNEIDLEKHILERHLQPGTDLESYITKWFLTEKFREKAPLWEIVILHLPFAGDEIEECETILLYKNHHCLADGYGFVHIVDKLTGNSSPYLVKAETDTFYQKLKDAFFFPKALTDYVVDVARTKDIFYPIKDPQRKWFISFATVDLKALKQIRRQTKTHFITVMMSLTIGALRRLVIEKRDEDEFPSHIYTANSLPWPTHPRTTLVNHWSGGVFKLPFQTSDPLERLRETDQYFNHFHSIRMHKMVKRLIIPVTWCIPSLLLRWGHKVDLYYFRYSNTFASLLLSDDVHFLLGNRIENIYLPLGLKDNVPTSVMFGVSTSHSNKVDISIVANSEIVENQEAIDRLTKVYFPMEIENLQKRLQESNNNDFIIPFEVEI